MGCFKPSKHKEEETTERANRLESVENRAQGEETSTRANKSESGPNKLESGTNNGKEEETSTRANKSESGESKAESGDSKAEISSIKAVCSSSTAESSGSKAEISSTQADCTSSIDGSFRMSELHLKRDKRNHFWQLAVQSGGRPEVWQALRVVAEAELGEVVQLLAANNIQLAKEDLTKFRDSDGREYELPRYVLRAYHNTNEW